MFLILHSSFFSYTIFNKDLILALLNRAQTGDQLLEVIDSLTSENVAETVTDTYLPILNQTVPELEEIAF